LASALLHPPLRPETVTAGPDIFTVMAGPYLKRDPDSVLTARCLLLGETGGEAWGWSDEEVACFADALLESFAAETAPARTALRGISEEIGRTRLGRLLGRLFGAWPPSPPNIYERLREIAEFPGACRECGSKVGVGHTGYCSKSAMRSGLPVRAVTREDC
jgi:hypothetical protein